MVDQTPYYVGFSHCLGIGPLTFSLLMNHYTTPQLAYDAPLPELKNFLGEKLAFKFEQFRNRFDPGKKIKECAGKNIQVIVKTDKRFPKNLRELKNSPICLYVKGDIDRYNFDEELCVSIVGTRKPSAYGLQISFKFGRELAEAGCIVVSGMALGIDASAHWGALESQGKTIAFLGSGVDIVYPYANSKLYKEILDRGGLLISEFPPGMTTLKGLFVSRNRLISGISKGVVVVEGMKDSGSLITARCAAEQGKEVFASPGQITSQLAEAPNLLIKEGAKMVTSVEDILEEFNLEYRSVKAHHLDTQLLPQHKAIFQLLSQQPLLSDDLAVSSKLPIHEILSILSSLEIQGVIERNSEGRYQVKI